MRRRRWLGKSTSSTLSFDLHRCSNLLPSSLSLPKGLGSSLSIPRLSLYPFSFPVVRCLFLSRKTPSPLYLLEVSALTAPRNPTLLPSLSHRPRSTVARTVPPPPSVATMSDPRDSSSYSIIPRIRYNTVGGINGPLVILENVRQSFYPRPSSRNGSVVGERSLTMVSVE